MATKTKIVDDYTFMLKHGGLLNYGLTLAVDDRILYDSTSLRWGIENSLHQFEIEGKKCQLSVKILLGVPYAQVIFDGEPILDTL